jgi:hypothetical protein
MSEIGHFIWFFSNSNSCLFAAFEQECPVMTLHGGRVPVIGDDTIMPHVRPTMLAAPQPGSPGRCGRDAALDIIAKTEQPQIR